MEISMEKVENSTGKCPECGKKVKFLKKHIKRMHSKVEKTGKFPENFQKISREKKEKVENSQISKNSSFLKEINLKGEFERMTETINPKKEETKEPKYECGSCHGTFNEKHKRCPHCGAEF